MNKQYALSIFSLVVLFFNSLVGQQGPEARAAKTTLILREAERETFGSVKMSEKLMPFSDEFCRAVISSAPDNLKNKVARLKNKQRREEMLPAILILHGPTGSGKSTAARVIAQTMDMPFIWVAGKKLANEYSNSGSAGIKRVENLALENGANIIIDEIDAVTKNKHKHEKNDREDETPGAFWTMLDALEENNLLFIGTTNDITGMPDPLKNRLEDCLYYMPYLDTPKATADLVTLLLNGHMIESEAAKQKIHHHLLGLPTRTIKKLIRGSLERARDRNLEFPLITFEDFKKASDNLKQGEKALNKADWNKKEVFTYTVQTIGAAAGVATVIGTSFAIYNGHTSLELAKKVAEFNVLNADRMYQLGLDNKVIAQASLDLANKSQEIAKKAFEIQKITSSLNIVTVAGAAIAAVATSSCTIS
jgi:AAA+ superfamily predicted ATPase